MFLIVDLEAACDPSPQDQTLMEIIEIGAVWLSAPDVTPTQEFQTFVRPFVRSRLSDFCTQLTGITQADVDSAPVFGVAYHALLDWLGGRPWVMASWGNYDVTQLARDCRRHGLAWPLAGLCGHINIKAAYPKAFGGKRCGLGAAIQRAGLAFEGRAHRGIDDARNIARLVPLIHARAPSLLFPSEIRCHD